MPGNNRFWVGGSGNWSDTAHWSATSGGSGGQTAPTSVSTTKIDGSSGGGTVTINTTTDMLSLDCTGFAGVVALGNNNFTIKGTVILGSGMSITAGTGAVLIGAAVTLTTNGVVIPALSNTSGSGFSLTLSDNLVVSGVMTLTGGSLTTNNHNISCGSLASSGTAARTIILGSSTLTITGTGTVLDFTDPTSLTFSGSSSTIVLSGSTAPLTFAGGSQAFGTLTVTSTPSLTVTGNNSFTSMTVAGPAAGGGGSVFGSGVIR